MSRFWIPPTCESCSLQREAGILWSRPLNLKISQDLHSQHCPIQYCQGHLPNLEGDFRRARLTVLDAEILKKFDRSRIRTYVSSDIEATITVENKGSAPINVMRLLDDIPEFSDLLSRIRIY